MPSPIYGDDYDLSTALAWFSQHLAHVEPAEVLASRIVERLGKTLNLTSAVLLLNDDQEGARPNHGDRDAMTGFKPIALWTQSGNTAAAGPVLAPRELRTRPLRRLPEGVWILLEIGSQRLGLLGLGPKAVADDYSAKDRALLMSLAPQLAVAIKNALLIDELALTVEQLERLQGELTEVHDEERQALARDLHDGPLQQLLLVQQMVHHLLVSGGADQAANLLTPLRDVISGLRSICMGLQPPDLEARDLAAGISNIADAVHTRNGLSVYVSVAPDDAGKSLPRETQASLYRCAQEMLQNVVKHARASEVYVYIQEDDGTLTLSIWDDGNGFEAPDRVLDFVRQGHFGLAGLEQRARRLGGVLRIRSAAGAGTQVSIKVPLGR